MVGKEDDPASYWEPETFQGRTVKLRGGSESHPTCFQFADLFGSAVASHVSLKGLGPVAFTRNVCFFFVSFFGPAASKPRWGESLAFGPLVVPPNLHQPMAGSVLRWEMKTSLVFSELLGCVAQVLRINGLFHPYKGRLDIVP